MKKIPYCHECKFYGGKGVCNHPDHPLKAPHIVRDFWCIFGKFKDDGRTEKC